MNVRRPNVPANLEPYVRALGVERAIAFLLAFGGAPHYFGDRAYSNSSAAAVIGIEGVEALGRELGRQSVRVPLAKRWIARHLRADGLPVAEIARRLHVSDVTVRTYLKDQKAPAQLSFLADAED